MKRKEPPKKKPRYKEGFFDPHEQHWLVGGRIPKKDYHEVKNR